MAESFFNPSSESGYGYIEMSCKPKRKHVRNGMLSPVDFERPQKI